MNKKEKKEKKSCRGNEKAAANYAIVHQTEDGLFFKFFFAFFLFVVVVVVAVVVFEFRWEFRARYFLFLFFFQ